MHKFVDAELVKEQIDEYDPGEGPNSDFFAGLSAASFILDSAPAANVREDIRANWKTVSNKAPRYACTNCKHLYNNRSYKFCPTCGARMS